MQTDKYLVILMENNIIRGYDYIYFLDSLEKSNYQYIEKLMK